MTSNSPWLENMIENSISAKIQNNVEERISYFPSYIETPIDIRL